MIRNSSRYLDELHNVTAVVTGMRCCKTGMVAPNCGFMCVKCCTYQVFV
jgi:hypothetical protein